MLLRTQRYLIQGLYRRSLTSAWKTFESATRESKAAQENILLANLKRNQSSYYGQQHSFSSIESVSDFQSKVPVSDYESLRALIDSMAEGQQNVITSLPIKIFEKTSGSSGSNKLIPYTKQLLSEFQSAISPWMFDVFKNNPQLQGTGSYWSISHAVQNYGHTKGGVKIGFESDTEYMGPLLRFAWNKLNSVPDYVARSKSLDEWRWQTCLRLLQDQDLGFISVWSPSFAIGLMDDITTLFSELLKEVSSARANQIQDAIQKDGGIFGRTLWPRLSLISTWGDGPSALFLPQLQKQFPSVTLQPKGLVATEGALSFPLWNHEGSVVSVLSHFFEFLDLSNPDTRPKLLHELEVGGLYSPLLTTGGGLYRYHLKDVVRCVGFFNETPLLRFEQKFDMISDICGEKLNAYWVQSCLNESLNELKLKVNFAMLAPLFAHPSRYQLFVESDASESEMQKLVKMLDEKLAQAHHYGYARSLKQLGPVTYQKVYNGFHIYENHLMKRGMKKGNIKPTSLDSSLEWLEVFKNA